jgi:hypothetical protein
MSRKRVVDPRAGLAPAMCAYRSPVRASLSAP